MKTCFFNSGVKFKNFKVLDNRNAKEKSELISEAEVVILAGGHVPTPKKVLIDMLEEMIHEQLNLIDKEELNNYINAKKYVQTLTEDEVKNLCVEVKDLYEEVLKEFEIKL